MPAVATDNPTHPIRVLLWSPRGSGTRYYGPGSFHYRLYSAAPPGQFDITLVHALVDQERFELFTAQHQLPPLPGYDDPPWSRWRMMRRFLRRADDFLREHVGDFDVFHGLTGFLSTVQPAATAQQLGLPAALFIANHRVDLDDSAPLQRMLRLARKRQRLARQLSAVVAMSEAIADELRDCGIDDSRIARIPMAVDTDRFRSATDTEQRSELRKTLGWADRPTLLFVGRVGPRKRPHLLIEAIGVAAAAGLDSQAVIAGPADDASYVKSMRERAEALNVSDRIIWAGFHEDPAPLYRAADAFALPSSNEGMPAAVVEAMASGLPSLVTRISGCEDLITGDESGRFIEPTAESIGAAWVAYAADEALVRQHGDAARQQAVRDHSMANVLQKYEALFRRIRR